MTIILLLLIQFTVVSFPKFNYKYNNYTIVVDTIHCSIICKSTDNKFINIKVWTTCFMLFYYILGKSSLNQVNMGVDNEPKNHTLVRLCWIYLSDIYLNDK